MSVSLRILLFVASVISFFYISHKLKKAEIGLMDTVFWILLAALFLLLGIFPGIAVWGADLFGFIAPVNFIFLLVLFLLLFRNFILTVRISKLEERVQNLIQEIAIRKNGDEK
ncbi:MAG: DUF2304 domain-containing protein [Lachnobacterium sp.]|nr:DUF2304 domain-containing protein [Lachnobacterium sp.]